MLVRVEHNDGVGQCKGTVTVCQGLAIALVPVLREDLDNHGDDWSLAGQTECLQKLG